MYHHIGQLDLPVLSWSVSVFIYSQRNMRKLSNYLIPLILLFIPLYPKFPLLGVSGTFVAVRLEDLLIGMSVVAYIVVRLIHRDFFPLPKLHRAILLFWLVGLVASFSGIFLTKTASLNLGMLHAFRRIEYMSLFFIAYDQLKSIAQLPFYIKTILLVGLIVAVYGLGQMFFQFPIISTNNSEFSKGLALTLGPGARINSTFAGHYDLAAYCLLPILMIIAILPVSRHRLVLLLMGGLIYWSMLLSASRITFASFFISTGLMLVLMRKKMWLAPLIVVSVAGFLFSPQLRGRYLDLIRNHFNFSAISVAYAQVAPESGPMVATSSSRAVDEVPDVLKPNPVAEDRSFNIRLQAEWPKALRAFFKNPLVGSGYSSIGLAADNEYLRILAETGALGLLAFALIALRYYLAVSHIILNYTPTLRNAFILSVSCFFFSLLMGGLFIDLFSASKIAMILWTIIGLSYKSATKLSK